MQVYIGIDPGPEKSAVVAITEAGAVVRKEEHVDNGEMEHYLGELPNAADLYHLSVQIAVEDFAPYGKHLGQESMATIRWIGVFEYVCHAERIERPTIKLALCDVRSAKDSDVRDALIHKYGPGKAKAVGRKATQGPLYGITGHLWPALAVAFVLAQQDKAGPRGKP